MIMDRFVNFTAGLVKTGAQISIIRAIHKKRAPKRPFSKSLSYKITAWEAARAVVPVATMAAY
jgi:hypothetical protein